LNLTCVQLFSGLFFLTERLMIRASKTVNRKPIVLIGAKTKNQLICEKDFKRIGARLHIATDDGSCGSKGFVSELFEKILERGNIKAQDSIVYACGPLGMLRAVSSICRRRDIDCELSIEERMACGIGACLGCSVKSRGPGPKGSFRYKLACKDGPVFKASEIILEDRC